MEDTEPDEKNDTDKKASKDFSWKDAIWRYAAIVLMFVVIARLWTQCSRWIFKKEFEVRPQGRAVGFEQTEA